MFKRISRTLEKMNSWLKAIFILIIFLIGNYIFEKCKINTEGFAQRDKFILKQGNDIYDNFYVDIYDDLTENQARTNFEIREILHVTKLKKNSKVLDIGSSTGHHVNEFKKEGYDAIGMDKSEEMVIKAKENYPELHYKQGDVMNAMNFQDETFDMITCLYFTLYYIENKQQFFKNCYDWLKPKGYLVVHLVNRDKFDPILPVANPIAMVSVQKYAKERLTTSVVKFNGFQYKAVFDLNDDIGTFTETMEDDNTHNVRQNIHTFHMSPQREILALATELGFELVGHINMVTCQYAHQYLYVLRKL